MATEGLDSFKNPDLLVKGRIYDTYTPVVDDASSIQSGIEKKIVDGQTQRVVVDLRGTTQIEASLRAALRAQPIAGLKEVIVITDQDLGQPFRP